MSIQPHHPPCCEDTPSEQRETRYPAVAYRALHHHLLAAVSAGIVAFHDRDHRHLINGHTVIRGIELGLARLAFTGWTEFAAVPKDGRRPVGLTPLGVGMKTRWDNERPLAERTGGAK